jgi:hypothetical protein
MSAETLTKHFHLSFHHQMIMMTLGKIQNIHNLEEFKGGRYETILFKNGIVHKYGCP